MTQKLSRFLRSELMGRWQVAPSQVAAIDVTEGQQVSTGQILVEIEETPNQTGG